jgi:thiol-disulfide isomerase/thioredoxin
MNLSSKAIFLKIWIISICVLGYVSEVSSQLNIGQSIPEVLVQNSEGQSVDLKIEKGKVYLIDFWASWCAPCRKANKKLVKLYDEFKSENFEIIGLSLDKDHNKWLNAVKTDKLLYTQFIDPKGFDAKAAEVFGVEALPSSFLFDEGGMLVKINPTESEIKNFLKQNK